MAVGNLGDDNPEQDLVEPIGKIAGWPTGSARRSGAIRGDHIVWGDNVVWGDHIVWGDLIVRGDSTAVDDSDGDKVGMLSCGDAKTCF